MSVNNGPLASNLIHVIGLKKTRDDGSTIVSDTITIGREGTTTNIENIVTSKIGYGPSNTLSIAGNVNVSRGNPVTALFSSFTPSNLVVQNPRLAYGAGKFVIVGDPGKVFYSTNGTNWTQVTSPAFPSTALRNIIYAKDRFVAISEDLPVKLYTSTDGVTWNSFTPSGTISQVYATSYGNNFLVGINPFPGIPVVSITSTLEWTAGWSTITFTGETIYGTCFGTMVNTANGTNVFLIFGKNNFIRRNQGSPALSGDWNLTIPTLPSISADWILVGFGNDTFMLTSTDADGKLTISKDAGKTWSTPINFGIKLKQPIYVEGVWYIASDDNFMMISKDNGITWEKRFTGIKSHFLAYGNGLFLTTSSIGDSNNVTNLIGFKTKREDGSLITLDTITIGREGTTTTIASDSLVVSKIIGTGTSNTIEERLTYTNSYAVGTSSMVTFGNGVFVITTDSGVYYSTDGTAWSTSTTPITGSIGGLAFGNGIFMLIVTGNSSSKVWTSPNGSTWTNISPDTIAGVYNLAYGNGLFVAISADSTIANTISTSTATGTTFTWTPKTGSGMSNLQGIGFGAMSNGTTDVWLAGGNSKLFRSIDSGGTWIPVTNFPVTGGIRNIRFANDVFMVSSWDTPGSLSISRDGGVNWSPAVKFGYQLSSIIYFEKKWYITATNSNSMLTSNDDGVTWRRVEGPASSWSAYGNSTFLATVDGRQSAIKFKTTRSDGSTITPDVITIGREGNKATIESDTLTISSQIYVPPATVTSEGGLTFSTDQKLLAYAPDIPYTGQRSNKVRIQTFSLSIMDEPPYYSGKNIASGLSQGSNSGGQSFVTGYTYTTGFAALGNINVNSTVVIGQTYKAVITLKSDTPTAATSVQIRNAGNSELLDFGYIGTTYKTYIGYFTPATTSLLLGVYSNTAVQKTIVIKHFSLEALDSPNVLDVTGKVGISGYVGIGTTKPNFPLEVQGTSTISALSPNGYRYFLLSDILTLGSATVIGSVSIIASNNIAGNGFFAFSDRRIKSNIVDIDDDRALHDLRLLKPKTYTYKDVIEKGTTPVYGFIAQEVKEVLSYASSPITGTVPNVYELATLSGDTLTLVMNTADLSRDASGGIFPKLKVKTRTGTDEFVNILEILDEHTLRVDKDLTGWGGELIGDQIVPGNRIFVYGQEVNDFHTLNKDAIWTVATAALQEVDRQLQAEKQKTALMQTALDALLERVNALEQKTSV